MEIVRRADPREFLNDAGPLLDRSEARNNLILGIAGTLVRRPDAYPVVRMWVALEGGRPVAAAMRTEPYNLVLADPDGDRALEALLLAVHEDDPAIPGLVANVPHAAAAAHRWCAMSGSSSEVTLEQGVFELTSVLPVASPDGAPRAATPEDRRLLLRWLADFSREALPRPDDDLERLERTLDSRFGTADAGFWFWSLGREQVSFAGFSGPTPTGIRIGPVYTPPKHRRRGYATALVAELSRALLDRGHRACFLYTDLSNATSNAIYERIGYRRVADAAEIRFLPAT